jgi:hypothetical protein
MVFFSDDAPAREDDTPARKDDALSFSRFPFARAFFLIFFKRFVIVS